MNLKQHVSYARALMGIMNGSKAFGGPVQATISLTNRCNIRCIHCYSYSKEVQIPNLRQVKKARRFGYQLPDRNSLKRLQLLDADTKWLFSCLEQLLEMGTRRYQISGSGEPFLHNDIMKFISYLRQHGSHCIVFTNGTLLQRDIIDDLIRLELDELRITTMAGSPEMYANTHPGTSTETFELLKQNLTYFHARKTFAGVKRPKITLLFVIIRQNVDEIMQFAQFAADVGAESIQYHPINYFGDERLIPLGLGKDQIALANEHLMQAKQYLELHRISHNIDHFYKIFAGHWDTSRLYQLIPCYIGQLNLSIDLDRCVYPCFGGKVPLGNTLDKSLKDIWYGNEYRRFRSEALTLNKRNGQIENCDCTFCVNHVANLGVYKMLHPFKGRSSSIRQLTPFQN